MTMAVIGTVLKHPVTILGGAGLGIYLGIAHPSMAATIAPFGDLYLAMLQMVALPIILCAVISGIGSLLQSRLAGQTMKRFAILLVAGPLFAAALSLAAGIVFQPGKNLPAESEAIFGELMSSGAESTEDIETNGFWLLLKQLVTDNIFVSLADGQSLQVLFFSILLGVALGLEHKKSNETALASIEAIFDSLLAIINWLVYLLPVGLLALLASQMSEVNPTGLLAMVKLAFVYAGTCLLLLLICNALIARRAGVSYLAALSALRESLFVSAGSCNSFAALPSALRGLQQKLHLDRRITDLVTPLALNLLPLATIVYFAVCALFIAQISGIELNMREYLLLFFGSIFAGLAAASLPSAAGIGVIALVLEPLGLPVGVALVLLIAIDPILDPINAAVDTHVACTAAALVADPPKVESVIDGADIESLEMVANS